jgi:hypothetical protein
MITRCDDDRVSATCLTVTNLHTAKDGVTAHDHG